MDTKEIKRGRTCVHDFDALLRKTDEALIALYGKGLKIYAGADRHRPIADVRNMAMCIVWEMSDVSLKEVAQAFGRSHSTLCLTKQSVESLRRIYSSYDESYTKLKSKIYELCEKESLLRGRVGSRAE